MNLSPPAPKATTSTSRRSGGGEQRYNRAHREVVLPLRLIT